jgi:hypothetical protein
MIYFFLLIFLRRAYALCSSFNNFHGKMRSMFFVLSDDYLGSSPKFAPGSQVKPSNVAADIATADETDDVVVDMEVSSGNNAASGSKALGGLSSQLKRKSGDLFSGTSKQRVLSQDMPDPSL